MGAHNAVDIIVVFPEQIQEARRKSSLSVVLMYHELSHPEYSFATVRSTAGECITGKCTVHGDPHV